MKVYFKNSKGKEILIGEADNDKQAYKKIRDFCTERGFNIPYMRQWTQDNRTFVDVSSWSEFFIIEKN